MKIKLRETKVISLLAWKANHTPSPPPPLLPLLVGRNDVTEIWSKIWYGLLTIIYFLLGTVSGIPMTWHLLKFIDIQSNTPTNVNTVAIVTAVSVGMETDRSRDDSFCLARVRSAEPAWSASSAVICGDAFCWESRITRVAHEAEPLGVVNVTVVLTRAGSALRCAAWGVAQGYEFGTNCKRFYRKKRWNNKGVRSKGKGCNKTHTSIISTTNLFI